MNKQRRAAIQGISDQLESLCSALEELKDEEQEYIENMPENLRSSERCDTAEQAVSYLEYALINISEAVDNCISAIE